MKKNGLKKSKRRIFPKELLDYHPYCKTDSVDEYYARLSDKILSVLDDYASDLCPLDEHREFTAVMVAMYFEDVVSGTKIWQSFTEEYMSRYGRYLPFYKVDDDYCHDEINVEDVMFLLWHRFQQAGMFNDEAAIYNPEHPVIKSVAERVMDILEEEYLTAPENERYVEWMEDICFDPEDMFDARDILRWFHKNCYLFMDNFFYLEYLVDYILENCDDDDPLDVVQKLYRVEANYVMTSRDNFLSLTTAEWTSRILSHHNVDCRLLDDIKVNPCDVFELGDVREDTFDLIRYKDKARFVVSCESVDIKAIKDGCSKNTKSYIACDLLSYGGAWWINGVVSKVSEETARNSVKLDKEEKKNAEKKKKFLEITGGEPIAIISEMDTLKAIVKSVGEELYNEDLLNEKKPLVVMYADEKKGFRYISDLYYCICSPDNPYYNKKMAELEAVYMLYCDDISYGLVRALWDKGCLSDIMIDDSQGVEYGKRFFAENADFLFPYIHNSSCKYDRL